MSLSVMVIALELEDWSTELPWYRVGVCVFKFLELKEHSSRSTRSFTFTLERFSTSPRAHVTS